MTTRKLLASLFVSLVFASTAAAQTKLAEEADDAFKKGFYFNAIELYKKAYTVEKKASTKAELIFKVGEAYRAIGDPQQAAVWYEKANKAQYTDPITYLYIGDMLKQDGKYAEAIASYNRFKDKKANDVRADASIAECQQAQEWKDSPTRYSVDPEVLLNTQQYDFTPAFADKKNEMVVYTSTRPGSTGTETDQIIGESFSDLFTSSRDRLGKWSEPVKLPISINTAGNEGAPIFNEKRNLMYFTRCPMEKKKVYGCDIWVAKKVGNNYAEPVILALRPDKNDTITIGHPALTVNEDAMIFASDMKWPGHKGGKDLYIVKLDKDGMPTGAPTNLGADINTAKDEMFPFVRQDGALYFSSTGRPSMGGMDIYRAEKSGENTWSAVDNMRSPINSSSDDFGIAFEGEEERGFFTSNRAGGKGQDDIWRFYLPDMIFALQGTAFDKANGQPLPGVKISVVGTNGSNFDAITDDNGGFSFVENGKDRYIKENTTYSVLVEKEGYLVVKDQATTVGLEESTTFVKEYFLQPAIVGGVVDLPSVLYEVDEFALIPARLDSLELAYRTLIDNPTMIVELRSHTDSRPTRRYKGGNMELSQKRAQSCVNYLVTKGIDPVRMVPVGRGPEEPRISDEAIKKMATKEEKEAAHQKNRRTDFKVLSYDYVPQAN